MNYDIAIIGAGPAGAALASFLPKQYRILLLDRRDLIDGENRRQSVVACLHLMHKNARENGARCTKESTCGSADVFSKDY